MEEAENPKKSKHNQIIQSDMDNFNELFQLSENELSSLDSLIENMELDNVSAVQGESFTDSCGAVCSGGWCANDFSG